MKSGRSAILTYHSLDDSGSVISVAPQIFRDQMNWLADSGIPVVPLEKIRDSPGAVALTFDDGFRNFLDCAAPLLQDKKFPCTVFAVSGFCGDSNRWPSQPAKPWVPTLPLMSWRELREAAEAGIDIGSHTATHPLMTSLPAAQVEQELQNSQSAIEDRIGKPVTAFAYPYGASSPAVRQAVRRRFQTGCGVKLEFVSSASDRIDLPRLDAFYLQNRVWFHGLGAAYGTAYIAARRWLRQWRATTA
ncbi:MAG TPA: polysaccharide deacetylase family protein [Bryobacteraceae bacterium]|nr:polysaccharide deacetylase family protein [Bryobacteraceae bacterium]